ncbi:hypothetical protein Tco_0118005 [Tanacetum coccineum]
MSKHELLVIAMKITLQAKQLALLLLILVLDYVFQANATSYKSLLGNVLSSRSQMLRSRALTVFATKFEEPQSDIFSNPPQLLLPSLRVRRSLRKKDKKRSRPPAPKLSPNRRPIYVFPPPPPRNRLQPPPPRYRPLPPPPPHRRPRFFPFFCSPPPLPPPPPPPPESY